MAKYNCITLKVKNGELEDFDKLRQPEQNILKNGNVVYIYRGTKSKKIYIGQTKHFIERNKQHYNSKEGKFNAAAFDQVCILISSYFNGSALDDVESQLITYFIADNPKSKVQYDNGEVINRNNGNSVNNYREREKVSLEVILPFWEKELYPNEWVNTPSLAELRTNALVKYSPIKQLTEQQIDLLNEINLNQDKDFVINGDAGTGKTVLLTHLVAMLLKEQPNKRIAVVLQRNWIETAKDIFRVYGMKSSNLTIATSIQLINADDNYDVVIVDESHKLSRKFSKQMVSFNKVYKGRFVNDSNHLECLKKMGSQIVLMYDILQAIRPANMTRIQFNEATKDFEKRYLKTQFRIQAPAGKSYTSDDFVNGIKYLLYKDTGLLEQTNFNPKFDRYVFQDKDMDAYFGYLETEPLKNLIDWIEEDRNFNPEHINRILGGLVEPWKQADGKDSSITHWHEGDIKRRWNSTQENWVYSDEEDAEEQIGSVFAVQGIDLNKVGVLVGNDLQVDTEGRLYGNPENFHNVNGKFSKEDESPENAQEFTLFVLNIYYILMTRGIDGIRLGFWKNDAFKEYMKKTLEII
ncbi:DNA/RNA helicase domain-containing protein [Lysinibacillus louembei]|uniref:DNA/RNA helicase domain-containing protein n=1 Tax=Lysinibacillus louembei TaxID=1470088 RepID=A0ABZ0RR99_9BACI|nr:DNA/RNA helicase domain-containing protein [Lysinibacillus louembei]WPK10752.1 DNA/RNA helicase domain-containing protein [Lysinibacillus louembei]